MVAAIFSQGLLWLENTSWAVAIRQSVWLYPALEVVHITGIALLAGAAFLFDLRLIGFSKNLPVTGLADHLLSWSRRGLLLVVPSGLLLFISNAVELGYNSTFWVKMTLLFLAGLNAAVFHRFTFRSSAAWNENSMTPAGAKVAAIFYITLWITIIACGRWLAY